MDFKTLLIVGAIAGLLTSLFAGGVGYRILRDLGIGIVGAFIGTWLLGPLAIGAPLSGIGGAIFMAFLGAVVLLLVLRVARSARRTRKRWTMGFSSSSPWRPGGTIVPPQGQRRYRTAR